MLVCLFVYDRLPGLHHLLLWIPRFRGSSARQVTLWSYFFITQFYALDQSSNNCMIRIWLICGFWEVDEVVPITCFVTKPLGVTSTLLIMPCYASRRGLGEWISMTDVRLLINGLLKVATLIHIWVDWGTWLFQDCLSRHLGRQGLPVFFYGPPPRLKGIIRLFHARNFRVQPHAIMGSSIAD